MNDEDYDPDDRIRPYNGHTPWEPGAGCLLCLIVILFVVVAVVIPSHGGHP